MGDPFFKANRAFIPFDEYIELKGNFSHNQLINATSFRQGEVAERLAVLREAEERFGYVHIGERNWLEYILIRDIAVSYGSWVEMQLDTVVFPGGSVREHNYILGRDCDCRRYYTEELSVFWRPVELSLSGLQLSRVDCLIPDDAADAFESLRCRFFEILHELSYYLKMIDRQWSEPMELYKLYVYDDARFAFDVHNDRGGGIVYTFEGSRFVD